MLAALALDVYADLAGGDKWSATAGATNSSTLKPNVVTVARLAAVHPSPFRPSPRQPTQAGTRLLARDSAWRTCPRILVQIRAASPVGSEVSVGRSGGYGGTARTRRVLSRVCLEGGGLSTNATP
jgi:hypothetical protein